MCPDPNGQNGGETWVLFCFAHLVHSSASLACTCLTFSPVKPGKIPDVILAIRSWRATKPVPRGCRTEAAGELNLDRTHAPGAGVGAFPASTHPHQDGQGGPCPEMQDLELEGGLLCPERAGEGSRRGLCARRTCSQSRGYSTLGGRLSSLQEITFSISKA